MKKIYLAAPYSPPKTLFWKLFGFILRWWRVWRVDKKAAELMMQGNLVFSPLSHSHPISKHCDVDPTDQEFWLRQDLWVLDICDEMHILCLDGWDKSKGIGIEIEYAKSKGVEIVCHEI